MESSTPKNTRRKTERRRETHCLFFILCAFLPYVCICVNNEDYFGTTIFFLASSFTRARLHKFMRMFQNRSFCDMGHTHMWHVCHVIFMLILRTQYTCIMTTATRQVATILFYITSSSLPPPKNRSLFDCWTIEWKKIVGFVRVSVHVHVYLFCITNHITSLHSLRTYLLV